MEHLWAKWQGFPGGLEVKVSACNAGDLGSIPGSGRFPGEGNGNPLQYSCLENPMDRGAWWATVLGVAKSRTRLSNFISLLLHGQSGKEQWCGGQRNLAQPQEEIQTKDTIVHPRA